MHIVVVAFVFITEIVAKYRWEFQISTINAATLTLISHISIISSCRRTIQRRTGH
jgi:hypothetical protein